MTGRHGVEEFGAEVSTFARAIVAKRVTILAGAGIILGELVRAGLLPDAVSGRVSTLLGVTLDILGVLTGIIWAQAGTTPAAVALQPKDLNGTPLLPDYTLGEADPELAAAVLLVDDPPMLPNPYMGGGAIPAGGRP